MTAFITRAGPELGTTEICFFEFASDRSRVISSFEATLEVGFSVSPDRKTFLFTRYSSTGNDLMLIENFR